MGKETNAKATSFLKICVSDEEKFPEYLLTVFLALFSILAMAPHHRARWWAENIPIILIVISLIWISRYFRFSIPRYALMFCLIFLHTIGGHYRFERVPFDYITKLFYFQRNNFDRMAHFTGGFYAFPVAEYLFEKKLDGHRALLFLFPVFTIFFVAGSYEIIEWPYAIYAGEAAGTARPGSKGNIWDAQKDMLADGLGALFIMVVYFIRTRTLRSLATNR